MAKIGIMGGTFDPIHKGHLLLGRQAYTEYELDEIWYMPSGQPPHKKGRRITPAEDRCAMVRLAIADEPRFQLSEFEIAREGNTYTAQTLKLLAEAYPEHEFHFIIGADSLYEIEGWYHPAEVLAAVPILVAEREYDHEHLTMDQQIAYLSKKYICNIQKLHCREIDVASSDIRRCISEGESIQVYVPAEVEAYILAHGLYQEEDE